MGRFGFGLMQPKLCLSQRTAGAMHFFLKHSFIGLFAIFLFGLILIYDYTDYIYLEIMANVWASMREASII